MKLQYPFPVDPDVVWEECLYHTTVPVRGGIAETDDPLAIDALLNLFYIPIVDPPDVPVTSRSRSKRE